MANKQKEKFDDLYRFSNENQTFQEDEKIKRKKTKDREKRIKKIKEEHITTAVETSLFIPTKNLKQVIPYIDYFYVDMKILNKNRCKNLIGGNLDLYKTNLNLLASRKMITIRIPVIGHYTDDNENKAAIIEKIKKISDSVLNVELIKGHNLSESKYKSLEIPVPKYYEVDDTSLKQYKERLEETINVPVKICKI